MYTLRTDSAGSLDATLQPIRTALHTHSPFTCPSTPLPSIRQANGEHSCSLASSPSLTMNKDSEATCLVRSAGWP